MTNISNVKDRRSAGAAVQPRVSVCLASHNGGKFIREQVESILSELSPMDEVIVCDDCSTDATCSIIMSFNDPRIKLLINNKNIGYVKNFEKALSLAKGKFIFLSDQDDIWVAGKVEKVLAAFQKDHDITLVYHNLESVDAFGKVLHGKFPKYSEGAINSFTFLIRQLFKAQIFGCACCLSRRRLDSLFPFPASVYAHDHWISVWAAVNGRIFFLNDVLAKHRKHDSNLSPEKHLSYKTIFKFRNYLTLQIIIAIYRRVLG
ncbi:MAG: glycosyltransferase family 2 protein [Deltaproteobacteria bacterium]|nr:glycosyltransferase family 2 protein [Candidatus Deferrimicrobium borealis]